MYSFSAILGYMGILANIGRIFYGLAIAAMGFLTLYYRDFPYMFLPPKRLWVSDYAIYIGGALLLLAGIWIVVGKKLAPVCLVLATVLLVIFCFCFIPYELAAAARYLHFGQWENAAKELAFAAGALVLAGRRVGTILYALAIISFGMDHYVYAHEATGYMPTWIHHQLFWIYLTGTALLGSGLAILLKIRVSLFAALLGGMIFIWVVILHLPKATAAPLADNAGEVASAFIALAYCGIAFAIAGTPRKTA
jgi:hypothetical protein